jgi:hypothetical protein
LLVIAQVEQQARMADKALSVERALATTDDILGLVANHRIVANSPHSAVCVFVCFLPPVFFFLGVVCFV